MHKMKKLIKCTFMHGALTLSRHPAVSGCKILLPTILKCSVEKVSLEKIGMTTDGSTFGINLFLK